MHSKAEKTLINTYEYTMIIIDLMIFMAFQINTIDSLPFYQHFLW